MKAYKLSLAVQVHIYRLFAAGTIEEDWPSIVSLEVLISHTAY